MHEKVACTLCHAKPVFTNVGKNCADCHADIHRRQFGPNCAQCHTVQGWDVATQQVKDHQNRFPLFGAHAAVDCAECHKGAATGIYFGLSTQCDSCHLKTFQQTTNPNHVAAKFSTKCDTCHSFDSWLGAKFDHSTTGFLLTNGHANVPCASCHINNNYNLQIAPTDCGNSGCHLTTWQQTTNPPHPKAGPAFAASQCAACHNTTSWTNVTFDHSSTGFLLTNGHANVPCASCHVNNNYTLTTAPTDCGSSGCHLNKWQQTTTPVHSTSGPAFAAANCANCHTTQGWDAASFDHSITGFPLVGTHKSPTPTPCASCHVNNNYSLSSADCITCHLSDWNKTATLGGAVPNHITAGFPSTTSACATCHSITTWADGKFDHSATGFPLTNGHANVVCSACHVNGNYNLKTAPTDCGNSGCHLTTWQQTNNPVHSASGAAFATSNCAGCHNTSSWTTATFDHSTTGFLLTNGHANVPCASCHVNNNYSLQIAPTDCGNSGCHLTTWQQTNNPTHSTSGAAFAASNCAICHTTKGWDAASFDHRMTGFTLTGTHMSPTPTPCASCHVSNNYTLNSADCMGCHQSAWNSTQAIGGNVPNHVAANFPTSASSCSTCHTITVWANGKFDHSTTGFPLTNSHQMSPAGKVTACTQCHIGGNYNLTIQPTDCGNSGCHLTTWQQTNNPTHSTAGAPFAAANCSTCHNTITWTTATFDHSTTGFALTGTHMSPTPTPCVSCHVNNNYTLSSTDCMGCHQSAWTSTQTLGGNVPNHVAANFPTSASACSSCHTITVWANGVFNHSTTGFPLTNSHQMAPAGKVTACTQCHVGGNYNLTSANTDCYGCHQTDWNSTQTLGGTVPNHVSAGFPTSLCSQCHNTLTWTTSTFNHASTGFTLMGTHATTPCASCHVNNNYSLTSANTDCMGCHLAAWNTTQTLGGNVPNHVSANFPTTAAACSGCHTITVWADGKFDHSTTGWALTGAHQMAPTGKVTACTQCHVGGNYSLTAANTACYSCHAADWNSTQTLGGSVPNHVAAGYPTTCDTCHTTTSWLGATFNHTYFPIPHHGSVCNDCHQVSTNYASFTCINCHTQTAHQQSQTNNQHGGVNGYSYGPTTCYSCHKNGGGG